MRKRNSGKLRRKQLSRVARREMAHVSEEQLIFADRGIARVGGELRDTVDSVRITLARGNKQLSFFRRNLVRLASQDALNELGIRDPEKRAAVHRAMQLIFSAEPNKDQGKLAASLQAFRHSLDGKADDFTARFNICLANIESDYKQVKKERIQRN